MNPADAGSAVTCAESRRTLIQGHYAEQASASCLNADNKQQHTSLIYCFRTYLHTRRVDRTASVGHGSDEILQLAAQVAGAAERHPCEPEFYVYDSAPWY